MKNFSRRWFIGGLVSAAVLASIDVTAGTVLKAGFARNDITPPLGIDIPGYFIERKAKRVLDPLYINCLALSDGMTTSIVQQVDTELMSDYVADRMRDVVSRATGVRRDGILLHTSHTHDGGYLRVLDAARAEKLGPIERLYMEMAFTRAADAAVAAIADLRPATLSCGRSVAKRISFGRNYLMKNGKVQTNPGTNNPDIVKPVGSADETVQVLRIDREGARAVCVINFQTHPDVIGGENLSADWPGLTRNVFEAATFGETLCLVLNGTQGDVNHCNVLPRPGELNGLTRDFDAVDRGYDHARHMANVLAAAALSVWMKCEPLETGRLSFGVERVRLPAHKAKDTDEKNLEWAKEVCALHRSGNDAEVSRRYGCYEMELTTELARAARICRLADSPDFIEVPVYAVAIGSSVVFGGVPGEPFNEIGVAIRKASPFRLTLLSCLTNGSRGYFPSAASFRLGGYETAASPFGPSVAEDLTAGFLRLFGRLKELME